MGTCLPKMTCICMHMVISIGRREAQLTGFRGFSRAAGGLRASVRVAKCVFSVRGECCAVCGMRRRVVQRQRVARRVGGSVGCARGAAVTGGRGSQVVRYARPAPWSPCGHYEACADVLWAKGRHGRVATGRGKRLVERQPTGQKMLGSPRGAQRLHEHARVDPHR